MHPKRILSVLILAISLTLTFGIFTLPALAGTLQFYANGEELVTEGFVAPKLTKDGWRLTFDHAFVNLANITAYITQPPYNAHSREAIAATETVRLEGVFMLDLTHGSTDHPPVLVGEVAGAPVGHYNAISWDVVKVTSGSLAGYSMILIGTAQKDGREIPFQIRSNEEATYRCGEYVGDERKGFVTAGGVADLEMTFHLDHIFGRADKAADDPLNQEAAGFEPFAGDSSAIQTIELEGMHVGHAGEGHCNVLWH